MKTCAYQLAVVLVAVAAVTLAGEREAPASQTRTVSVAAAAQKSMKTAHAQLDISEAEWQAMLDDFRITLDKFDVPAAEQGELVTIVNSTKADIVIGPRAAR